MRWHFIRTVLHERRLWSTCVLTLFVLCNACADSASSSGVRVQIYNLATVDGGALPVVDTSNHDPEFAQVTLLGAKMVIFPGDSAAMIVSERFVHADSAASTIVNISPFTFQDSGSVVLIYFGPPDDTPVVHASLNSQGQLDLPPSQFDPIQLGVQVFVRAPSMTIACTGPSQITCLGDL
jgi:hypothetical protein